MSIVFLFGLEVVLTFFFFFYEIHIKKHVFLTFKNIIYILNELYL
jgi:hypothetical protein